MSITLPQSTTDWIFYIINIATFLFCGINTFFRQDFDGASSELVVAILYEYDRKSRIPKKKRKYLTPQSFKVKTSKCINFLVTNPYFSRALKKSVLKHELIFFM